MRKTITEEEYTEHLGNNLQEAFEQGNKRAAWAAGRLFLRKNGYNISPSVEEQKKLAEMVKRMIERKRQSTRDRYFDYLLNAIYDLLRLSL